MTEPAQSNAILHDEERGRGGSYTLENVFCKVQKGEEEDHTHLRTYSVRSRKGRRRIIHT